MYKFFNLPLAYCTECDTFQGQFQVFPQLLYGFQFLETFELSRFLFNGVLMIESVGFRHLDGTLVSFPDINCFKSFYKTKTAKENI